MKMSFYQFNTQSIVICTIKDAMEDILSWSKNSSKNMNWYKNLAIPIKEQMDNVLTHAILRPKRRLTKYKTINSLEEPTENLMKEI